MTQFKKRSRQKRIKYKKHLISEIKSNRLFATSLKNKLQGKFERVDKIE